MNWYIGFSYIYISEAPFLGTADDPLNSLLNHHQGSVNLCLARFQISDLYRRIKVEILSRSGDADVTLRTAAQSKYDNYSIIFISYNTIVYHKFHGANRCQASPVFVSTILITTR